MVDVQSIVASNPKIMGGTPCFVGTRVPFQTFMDYIAGGETLDTFLDHFPTVSREQATEALAKAGELLLSKVR